MRNIIMADFDYALLFDITFCTHSKIGINKSVS